MTNRTILIRKAIEDILGGINCDLRRSIVNKYTPILQCKTSGLTDEGLEAWLISLKKNTGTKGLEQAVIDAINL